ncbi:MAG: hypothetical protein O3A46_10390 [Candidatus Poribacteria bacterium]|nr:hypothetical protein [Candidatus Poribacteria bacterium]
MSKELSAQVAAVRRSVGVADLSGRGKIAVTGGERAQWLHNITSNHVDSLQVGRGNYGMVLTDRGKIVSDYRLIVREDALLLDVEASAVQPLLNHVWKFLIAEDAKATNVTGEWAMFGVFGKDAAGFLEARLGVENLPQQLYRSIQVDDTIIVRMNRVGEPGFDVLVPSDRKEDVWHRLSANDATVVGDDALETLRIEAGIPRFGADIHDDIIPLEARLFHGIDFYKGCYLGQEIVARMHYRGHPNKLMMNLRFDGEIVPAVGTDIFPDADAEKRIGWITSATHSPSLDAPVGLGYIRARDVKPDARFIARDERGNIGVEISAKPFVGENEFIDAPKEEPSLKRTESIVRLVK